jgi:predicted O-linked N-acetylglucosamine transferase (SPINDLY family)
MINNKNFKKSLNDAGVLYNDKKFHKCIEVCSAWIAKKPNELLFYDLMALSYLSLGDDEMALKSYELYLLVDKSHFLSNLNIAKIHIKNNKFSSAIEFLNNIDLHCNDVELVLQLRGICNESMGLYKDAIDNYADVITINKKNSHAYMRMASSLNKINQGDAAIELLDYAFSIMPETIDILFTKASILMDRGLNASSLGVFEIIKSSGNEGLLHICAHAELLFRMKKIEESIGRYEEALSINPNHIPSLINYGNLLSHIKKIDEAVLIFEKVLTLDVNNSMALTNIANCMLIKRDLDNAWKYAERTFSVNPKSAGAFLYTMSFHCDWERYQHVLNVLSNDHDCELSGPFVPIIFSNDPMIHLKYNKNWSKNIKSSNILGPINKFNSNKKIKIGYYSCDFFNHATAMLIEGLLANHDRERFELHAFSLDASRVDDYTHRIRKYFDYYHEVYHFSDRAVSKLSRDLSIDIAIDLKGYTEGSRPGIFAERAAPIQINYLGYPGTMGADFIDYIIADNYVVTSDNRNCFSENIIYMPICYQPNNNNRPLPNKNSARPVELPNDVFVFCSFNNSYKINPNQFKIWMSILRKAPESVFWMLEPTGIAKTNLIKYASDEGVDPERIIFAPFLPEREHLTRLSHADLFLDSFPCNAHTTASDAMWAGVPLLTRSGNTFASRVAGSILRSVDLNELIVKSDFEYECLALRIYNDALFHHNLKKKLKENIGRCSLYNTEKYTIQLERALIEIFERNQKNLDFVDYIPAETDFSFNDTLRVDGS